MGFEVKAFYLLVFALSAAFALLFTPLAQRLATKLDFVDAPGARKVHAVATPYLGGAVLWLACMGAMLLRHPVLLHLAAWTIGGTLLLLVGLWDDKHGMMPRHKLLGQFLAGLVVVLWGDSFQLFGIKALDQALTVFWIIGLSNAFNLLDNMDGLSAGTAGISCFFLFLIAAQNGQHLVGALALAIFGACLGFLRYNFAPPAATIFMGDAGSLFLGFTLAYAGVRLRLPTEAGWDFLVPVLVLGLPILDTTLVTAMRMRAGRPVALGGKDHCSHRLVALGYSKRQAVLAHYVMATVFGLLGFAAFMAGPEETRLGVTVLVVAVAATVRFLNVVGPVEVYADAVAPEPAERHI
jgi:UDP-GlcNAc:undecaprenyl-phosphate GlcNAc-1-phosphate transferase